MKPWVRNLFLVFGIVSIVVMLLTFENGYDEIEHRLLGAGVFFPAVFGVWIFVYLCETRSFQLIVNSGRHDKHMHFRHAFKLTLSGFAFSATTPMGIGGCPYRMMEMSKYIGIPCAMSKMVLYSMSQILSQFLLWTTAVVIFIVAYSEVMTTALWISFSVFLAVLVAALFVFKYGYENGLIEKLYCLILLKIPFVKKPLQKFYNSKKEAMQEVDRHTSYLREQPYAFWGCLVYEYLARLIQALEYLFIMIAFDLPVDFSDAVLVLAFSSFVGNLLFFLPMQLGAREGGVAWMINVLNISTTGVGLFVSFYTRVREIIWIAIGVSLVKVGNKRIMRDK